MKENLPSPDIIGQGGKAWRFDLERIRKRSSTAKPDSSLVSWLIEAGWAHPLWHSYALHLYHLRPVNGLGEPKIFVRGATHEMILFALDPEKLRDLKEMPYHLHPANFAAQFIAEDEGAIGRVNDTVREIVSGVLSPDTDHLQSWIARYGDAMIKGDPSRAGETKITLITPNKTKDFKMIIEPQKPTPRQS